MPVYRVTIGMNQSVLGATETWWTRGNVSLGAIPAQLQQLLNARANIAYTNQEFVGVRVADLGDSTLSIPTKRRSVFLRPGKLPFPGTQSLIQIPDRGTISIGAGVARPDQYRAALQQRITYLSGRQAQRYLAGLPDHISQYEPLGPDRSVQLPWWNSYTTYISILATQWAIRARTPHPTEPYVPCIGVHRRESAPTLAGVGASTGVTTTFAVGEKIHLTGFRHKPHQVPSINGTWYVDSVNNTLVPGQVIYWLRGSAPVPIDEIKILGQMQRVSYVLANIEGIEVANVVTHRRGRPLGSPRGRRLTRASYDP